MTATISTLISVLMNTDTTYKPYTISVRECYQYRDSVTNFIQLISLQLVD